MSIRTTVPALPWQKQLTKKPAVCFRCGRRSVKMFYAAGRCMGELASWVCRLCKEKGLPA